MAEEAIDLIGLIDRLLDMEVVTPEVRERLSRLRERLVAVARTGRFPEELDR